MKKLNITFCSFPDYSSNAKPLYEYMKKRYKDKMNFTWVVRTDEMLEKLAKKQKTVYKIDTPEYYKYIKKSNIIFSTHADLIEDKPLKSLYVDLWHGIGSKKCGHLLDNISSFDDEWYKKVSKKVDYFIVPTDFWATIFSTMFNVKKERLLNLGYPKLDSIKNKNARKNLSKILKIDIDKFFKIIYYTPTFKKRFDGNVESIVNTENVFDLPLYNEEILINFLEKNNYLLCVKLHPSEEVRYKFPNSSNIKLIAEKSLTSKGMDINSILNAADLLVNDYSSLGIEFSFLNKPVISLNASIESYTKNRGIVFNEFDFWCPNTIVNNIVDLLREIDKLLTVSNEINQTLKIKKTLWFGNLKDGGCKNICNYFFDDEGRLKHKNINYYDDVEDNLLNKISFLNKKTEKLNQTLIEKEKDIQTLQTTLGKQQKQIKTLKLKVKDKNKEISIIINSKGWKILEKLRKLKKLNR